MVNKSEKKTSLAGLLWLLPVVALLFLGGITGYYTYRYQSIFLPGTEIAGTDCSNMTVSEAAEALKAAAADTRITLGDSSGAQIAEIPLGAFVEDARLEEAAQRAFSKQRETAGLLDWLLTRSHVHIEHFFRDVNAGKTAAVLEETLYGDTPRVSPVSARVELTDEGYRVVEEEQGNIVDVAVGAAALAEGLWKVESLTAEPPAVIADRAVMGPALTADSPEIKATTDALDDYLLLPVTLDFGDGEEYALTAADIRSVSDIRIRSGRVRCTPDPDKVRALTDDLADRYAYDGVFAKFRHVQDSRPYVYYRVGDNGWILNRDALAEQVLQALTDREAAVVAPEYDCTWYWKDYYKYNKVGDTYIEISLDNQYLWAYKDGVLVVETPVVTGSVAGRSDTRRGCFRISYKVEDVVLRGPTWNDHVDFWMPFDGDIGLHDSSWRDEYGGDIYLTDGSHGCINTPLQAMRIIYRNFRDNDIVIVY